MPIEIGKDCPPAPTPADLCAIFTYDPETGDLRYRESGKVAGYINNGSGHRLVKIGGRRGKMYRASRIIWAMMTGKWPDGLVDHADALGPKADWGNRWSNLRLASRIENARNHRLPSNNTSGLSGVYWYPDRNKWSAEITIDCRRVKLGCFHSKCDAIAARLAAERKHWGDFAPKRGTI